MRSAAPEAAPRASERLYPTSAASTLDVPRRLVDLGTGLPALTSLSRDLRPIAADPEGATIYYVHVPSSAILEERFGWEVLGAYRELIAHYLTSFGQDLRRDRVHCTILQSYADDFAIIVPMRENDAALPTIIADGLSRHLAAIDGETASLLQVYVGMAQTRSFPKIHPERRLYRAIQRAQTEATDVGRQKLSAQVRVLDRCITQQQFDMVFQPIARLSDHGIYAYEALVRCQHQDLKNPHVLFNVAEQSDRVWTLSRLLRHIAVAQVPNLPGNTLMFVNLHPRDFDDPELIIQEGDLATQPERLVVEVTERAAICDLTRFREQVRQLRELGIRIAMDDVGSGYSSLGLVADLSPDLIKLDMALIRDIHESPVRQNLVRNMVAFAGDLGAEVVAEGVEILEELEVVRDLGCQLVQGYFLARPGPPFIQQNKIPPVA